MIKTVEMIIQTAHTVLWLENNYTVKFPKFNFLPCITFTTLNTHKDSETFIFINNSLF